MEQLFLLKWLIFHVDAEKILPQEWLVEMIGLELKKNFPQEWLVKMITRKAWIAFLEAKWLIILEGRYCNSFISGVFCFFQIPLAIPSTRYQKVLGMYQPYKPWWGRVRNSASSGDFLYPL